MTNPATKASNATATTVYVGRQPIYDTKLDVFAYELLFRNSEQNAAGQIGNAARATSNVFVNTFMEIGLDNLVGDKKAFINFPRELLLDSNSHSLPQQHIVIEVLETVEIDDEIAESISALVKHGFSIALDDFVYHDRYLPLLRLCEFVKVDVMALGLDACRAQVAKLKPLGVTLLAEKVETREEFEACSAMGFELFQGYYFCRPQIVKGSRIAVNNLVVLNLVAKLFDSQIGFEEIEKMISQDVGLSYRLLRIINSASFSIPRKVDSLKHAVTILGLKQLRTWISLLVLAGIEGKPKELFKSSLICARMCQTLGPQMGMADIDACFLTGLFSNLDALLDQPLEDLVNPLPLSAEIKSALLEGKGELGGLLGEVVAFTGAQWAGQDVDIVFTADLNTHFVNAIAWADELVSML